MNNSYEKLLHNLNVVKWELKNRNDPTLNLCVKYIKDAIIDAGRLNYELEMSRSFQCDRDTADDWCDD